MFRARLVFVISFIHQVWKWANIFKAIWPLVLTFCGPSLNSEGNWSTLLRLLHRFFIVFSPGWLKWEMNLLNLRQKYVLKSLTETWIGLVPLSFLVQLSKLERKKKGKKGKITQVSRNMRNLIQLQVLVQLSKVAQISQFSIETCTIIRYAKFEQNEESSRTKWQSMTHFIKYQECLCLDCLCYWIYS